MLVESKIRVGMMWSNYKISEIRNDGSEISGGEILNDMLGEAGAFEPGGAIDIVAGDFCGLLGDIENVQEIYLR